ncbi:MAG: polymer-forming cytoskeletal protein [Euryarchaeota archaeon]|nr:polymer-forming cytoskeletal protein [Euryarchaeota archaeon]
MPGPLGSEVGGVPVPLGVLIFLIIFLGLFSTFTIGATLSRARPAASRPSGLWGSAALPPPDLLSLIDTVAHAKKPLATSAEPVEPRRPSAFGLNASTVVEGGSASERIRALDWIDIDVPTRNADEILRAFLRVGWQAKDTGRTVTTAEDEDALTTLSIVFPSVGSPTGHSSSAEEAVAMVDRGPTTSSMETPGRKGTTMRETTEPLVLNSVFAIGDLLIGDGVETETDFSATGDVTVGKGACVRGHVRAGGDLRLRSDAVVGDVSCGGELYLEKGARISGSVEAARGLSSGSRSPSETGPSRE